jgi:predicted kinase
MTAKFYMMIGLPASGKSTIAKDIATRNDAVILESDSYREKEYGDASVQGDNVSLFRKIKVDAIMNLTDGMNVVFDATNLSRKKRVEFIKVLGGIDVHKIAVLCATPFEVCVEQDKMRERTVGSNVIDRMRRSFNPPVKAEGWDEIEIRYADVDSKYKSITSFFDEANTFEQNNPHHSMTLGAHCRMVAELLHDEFVGGCDLSIVGLLHDNGKLYTKTTDVETNISHYYGHAEVGAYECLFYLSGMDCTYEDVLFYSAVICYHMRPYQMKTEKAKKKFYNAVGEDIFTAVVKVNRADITAH